jgi:hypothetical protein
MHVQEDKLDAIGKVIISLSSVLSAGWGAKGSFLVTAMIIIGL